MKKMKKLFALLLVFCMVFALCACGNNSGKDSNDVNSDANNEQTSNDDADDVSEDETDEGVQTQAAFSVKIVDEGGNPVSGVMVQVCKDSCIPAMSDANGIASFSVQIEDGHKLSVMSMPEGYEYDGEAEVYLEAGATDYTLTLKAVK